MTRVRCSGFAGMTHRHHDKRCRNTTEHPQGTCALHRKCTQPGCSRRAAAQARVNAADELRSQRSALEFRVTVEVEGFTKAEPELSAKELRAQVAKLRASVAEWRAVDQKHATLMGRIFGDCEHAGCGEPARWCRGYPRDALLCKQHDEERIAERAKDVCGYAGECEKPAGHATEVEGR